MKLLILLFTCLLGVCLALKSNPSGRLVAGSTVASLTEFPWHVSIQKNGLHYCGGTIIDSRWILTVASCVVGLSAKLAKIRYNTLIHNFEGDFVDISDIIVHPEFSPEHYANNIALIYTSADMKIDPTRYAQIPCSSMIQLGALVRVPGWGYPREESGQLVADLQKIQIPYLEDQCAPYHTSVGIDVNEKMFCAGNFENGGIGLCKGDEGGAAIRAGFRTAYGIASFHKGCGLPRYTSVFTKVSTYHAWIKQISKIECVVELS